MNSSETLLYYLYFEIGLGFVPLKKGYALDYRWAEGVYRAAKKDRKVYDRLLEVVSENSLCRRTLPPQLRIFVGEVTSETFPIPETKNGPDINRNRMRNICISKCMMLLCDELKFQHESSAKKPVLAAWDLIDGAFKSVEFNDRRIAKPSRDIVDRVWKNKTRESARDDVKMLKWLEKHGKANRWYNLMRSMHWTNRFM